MLIFKDHVGKLHYPKLKHLTTIIRHGDRTRWNGSPCWIGDDAVFNCTENSLYAISEENEISSSHSAPRYCIYIYTCMHIQVMC